MIAFLDWELEIEIEIGENEAMLQVQLLCDYVRRGV